MVRQMVRKIVSIVVFLLICSQGYNQVLFDIDQLKLSNYNLGEKYCDFNEDHWTGPTISINGTITNCSSNPISFNSIRDSVILMFNYEKEEYKTSATIYFLDEDNFVSLKPGGILKIAFSSHLFLGIGISKHPSSDFRDILLQALPTLEVQYYIRELERYNTTSKINHIELVQ